MSQASLTLAWYAWNVLAAFSGLELVTGDRQSSKYVNSSKSALKFQGNSHLEGDISLVILLIEVVSFLWIIDDILLTTVLPDTPPATRPGLAPEASFQKDELEVELLLAMMGITSPDN